MTDMEKAEPLTRPNCGSIGGYETHRTNKEKACEPCASAIREYQKNYRKNHKRTRTRTPEQSKAYRLKNIEKIRERERIRYIKESEAQKAARYSKVREWAKKNPEKRAIYGRKHRAQRYKNGHEPYTIEQVLNTYGSLCHICGVAIDLEAPRNANQGGNWHFGLHIDHVIPISKNGSDTLDNVRPAHAQCNIRKGAK